MQRKHLVIPRVGRQSLHPHWLKGDGARSWDLHLCPYEPLPPEALAGCTSSEIVAGPKWAGLRELLGAWNGWREYEYIWLPDDDVLTTSTNIDRFFSIASTLKWDLCAPALHEDSYYAHYSTMRNRHCSARRMGFVEIMVPCFSRAALERLLPTLALSTTGWGWGLDSVWPKLLGYERMGVIDDTPVLHTRPVGAFRDAELGRRVLAESDRLLNDHDCAQVHRVFEAYGPDLRPMTLDPTELTALLADGWQYLVPANPSVLPWIVEAQSPPGGWPTYPVAGTPSRAAREGAPLQAAT